MKLVHIVDKYQYEDVYINPEAITCIRYSPSKDYTYEVDLSDRRSIYIDNADFKKLTDIMDFKIY